MDNIKTYLQKALKGTKIELTPKMFDDFQRYYELLIEWNEKINLTAITDIEEVAIKHFADSLMLLNYADIKENATLIDVGTGAGFPGIPIKIARPDINLTLLDSLNKRLLFLKEVCNALDISADIIHSRAEDGARDSRLREKFDVVTSRAVANMNVLSEYCLPYVKVGGVFVPMKGKNGQEEMDNAQKAVPMLGGKFQKVISYTIADDSQRTIIVIDKAKATSTIYPRQTAKIKKKHL